MADNPLLQPGMVVLPRQNDLMPGNGLLRPRLPPGADVAAYAPSIAATSAAGVGRAAPVPAPRFPMQGGGTQRVADGDAAVDYRVTPHAGVLVDKLYVAPEARGQGQGRAMMQQLLAEIDAAGLPSSLIAEPQEDGVSSTRLRRFYRGLGFKSERGMPESMVRPPAIRQP